MADYIKKSELAGIVGTSPAYITKLEKKGIFEECTKDKLLLRFESIEAYIDNYDFSRDSQREANAKNKDDQKLYITKKDLAAAFALKSATEITRLDKKGIFDECYDGRRLKRVAALKAYVDFITKIDDVSDINVGDIPGTNDSQNEQSDFKPQSIEDIREFYQTLIKLAKSPAQKASISKDEDIKIEKFLKNQEMEKNLISVSVVEKEAFEMARKVRDSFLSLPDRLSSDLVGKDKREIQQILLKEINYSLEALSNG